MNGFQTYAIGRDITYTNVKFTGAACAVPIQNMNWTAQNSDFSSCAMEVDKIKATKEQECCCRKDWHSCAIGALLSRRVTPLGLSPGFLTSLPRGLGSAALSAA